MRKSSAFTLIELLIVIAIIGILMGLLFPAANGAMDAARKAQAKNDAVQIATAVTAYETEYGRLPGLSGSADESSKDVDLAFVQILTGQNTSDNPRGIVFLEVQEAKSKKSGTNSTGFVDPWSNKYKIALDGNYDNSLSISVPKLSGTGSETVSLRKKIAVWNQTSTNKRAVRSWE
jgi:prepilin-type N-terminal cleavage/methylation domain-containing protein